MSVDSLVGYVFTAFLIFLMWKGLNALRDLAVIWERIEKMLDEGKENQDGRA